MWLLALFSTLCSLCPPQDPPPPPPPSPVPAPVTPAPAQQEPAPQQPAAPQGPEAERRDRPQGAEDPDKKPEKKEPRPGIPVTDGLVVTHCARCHAQDKEGLMTRISYLRKSPEGWSESLKRMVRLHGMQISPADARQVVRYLANDHGLTRSEAERSLYESERRVHWSEEHHDEDFRQACSQCHPLGRVLAQQRDREEWQQLRATHVAMFPLARGQMGGGPPRDESENRGPRGGNRRGGRAGTGNQGAQAPPGPPQAHQPDRGDRVLQQLAEKQPLFTPEWEQWTVNRREVPLAGTWTVVAQQVGRGDGIGSAVFRRVDEDEYEVDWQVTFGDGSSLQRSGRALLYAGYSLRGRSTDPGAGGRTWREVLLLDAQWQQFRGRAFSGDHDEIGIDLQLHRHGGVPRVFAATPRHVTVPAKDFALRLHGEALPETVAPADLHLGAGVTVTKVERRSSGELAVQVDVAPNAASGPRQLGFGAMPGVGELLLYDEIDYLRVTPVQGLARIGGARMPKQFEQFGAVCMHRGKDGKSYTDDDVSLMTVPARWELTEFAVREDDDDLKYVGALDAASGLFTPNIDGPNLSRKWQANNVGDVFAFATATVQSPIRPEKPPEPGAPVPPAEAPKLVEKTLRARGHLLVTVPLYVRWNQLEWEDR